MTPPQLTLASRVASVMVRQIFLCLLFTGAACGQQEVTPIVAAADAAVIAPEDDAAAQQADAVAAAQDDAAVAQDDAAAPQDDAAAQDDAAEQDDAALDPPDARMRRDGGGRNRDAGMVVPSGDGGVQPCPTTGMGAIIAPAGCVVFTPASAGASAAGDHANDNSYALEPAGTVKDALVLFIPASGGIPARQVGDPTQSFYNAAAGAGYHVLALAYASSQVIGILCSNDGPCFEPARRAVITGVPQAGAPQALAGIQLDEGIIPRTEAALRKLALERPGEGWEQYLDSNGIVWPKIIAAGHSQGGGHAAFLGKLFSLRQVVQLASTCDAVGNMAAPWTHADATWATPPATRYVGFATAGDPLCGQHATVWQAMGLDPSRMIDDAEICGGAPHAGAITCIDNFARWPTLLD